MTDRIDVGRVSPGSGQSDADDREFELWVEERVGADYRWCRDCDEAVFVLDLRRHWRENHRPEKGEDS